MKLIFRKLYANEIDVRIATVSEKGVVLLLYKDARVDQNILDETVGAFHWKRDHQSIDGRLYCTVSVYDEDRKEWVSKQDVGTESYSEKEKGQASDSFKRACFNWGIGRELYTAPFIFVTSDNCTVRSQNDRNGSVKHICYDKFSVSEIAYKDGSITELVIVNDKTKKQVFTTKKSGVSHGNETTAAPISSQEENPNQMPTSYILENELSAIAKELKRTGIGEQKIRARYGIPSLDKMTIDQYRHCMNSLSKTKDKEIVVEQEGLPWR